MSYPSVWSIEDGKSYSYYPKEFQRLNWAERQERMGYDQNRPNATWWRDSLAKEAMKVLLSTIREPVTRGDIDRIASKSYEMADAMMRTRTSTSKCSECGKEK